MAEDVQALTNGEMAMDGTETHEMNEMNDMNDPEKGRKNVGYEDEDEETTPLANDSEHKQTADSGVEIDGTDSEPNGEHRGSPNPDGEVDEEDGLFESFAETIQGLELSLTESELTERDNTPPARPKRTAFTADQDTEPTSEQSTEPTTDTEIEPSQPEPPTDVPSKVSTSEQLTDTSPPGVAEESPPEHLTNEQPDPSEDIQPPTPTDPPPAPPTEISPLKKEPVSTAKSPEPPLDPPNYPPPPPVVTPPPDDPCEPEPDTGEVDPDCDKSEDPDSPTDEEGDGTDPESPAAEELHSPQESAAPWPEALPSEKEHFVYVSNLDLADGQQPEIDSARSQDTVDSIEEIPYTKLEEAPSETGLETDSSLGDTVEIRDPIEEPDINDRPSTSTPKSQRPADLEPPTPPELTDELNATIEEPSEWPAPPTPIAGIDAPDNGVDSADIGIFRSPSPPKKPRRSVNSMHYEQPIMAYDIEMENVDGEKQNQENEQTDDVNEETEFKDTNEEEPTNEPENIGDQDEQDDNSNDTNETTEYNEETPPEPELNSEEDLTVADDALLINDTNEETDFRDDEMPPPPAELLDNEDADTETATEYENNGTLRKNGELETPEYTPPETPVAGHTTLEMENPTYDQVEESNEKFKFVQHADADEEVTRLESRARFKRKTDYKCLCLSLLCFLVMLLAAAFAFFVAMFLVGSLDGFLNRNDNEEVGVGVAPPARPAGAETIDAPPITMITTQGQIELDRPWIDSYDFPSAQSRIDLEIAVIAALDDTYRWGSTKYVYKDSRIKEFRRGPFAESVFVRFTSEFYDIPDSVIVSSSTPSLEEQYALAEEEMSQIVFQTLAASIDEPTLLGSIQARQGSLELLNTEITRQNNPEN